MKKVLSFIIIIALLAGLTACRKEPEMEAIPDEPVDSVAFREEAKEMTAQDAEEYLKREDTDKTAPQYKEAVYTLVEQEVSKQIENAKKNNQKTDALSATLEGIWFRFVEGNDFTSNTVRSGVSKLGTFAAGENGWYRLTFYDRTLADTVFNTDQEHALKEYTKAVELLLQDPNVVVKTTLE